MPDKPATSGAGKARAAQKLRPPTLPEYGTPETWTQLLKQENELRKHLGLQTIPMQPRSHLSTPVAQQLETLNMLTSRLGHGPIYNTEERRPLSAEERAEFSPEQLAGIKDYYDWQTLSANPYQEERAAQMLAGAAFDLEKNRELVAWMDGVLSHMKSTEMIPESVLEAPTAKVYELALNIGNRVREELEVAEEMGGLDMDSLDPAFRNHLNAPIFTSGYTPTPLELTYLDTEAGRDVDLEPIFATVYEQNPNLDFPVKAVSPSTTQEPSAMHDFVLDAEEEAEAVAPATSGFWSNLAKTYDDLPGGRFKDLVASMYMHTTPLAAFGPMMAPAVATTTAVDEYRYDRPEGFSVTGEVAKDVAPVAEVVPTALARLYPLPSKDDPKFQRPPIDK